MSQVWLALVIGNSRLHWAQFSGTELQAVWHTPHFSQATGDRLIQSQFDFTTLPFIPAPLESVPEIWIASVVPDQSSLWQRYPAAHFVTLDQIPLQGMYATFGIDRALALWGAIATLGSPILVIDAGTALTFTGTDGDQLLGGAILPGLGLQLQSLGHSTAALPTVSPAKWLGLPTRWAKETPEAIASGVLYTLLAGIQGFVEDWWQQFPHSAVVLTGGDSDRLHHALYQQRPEWSGKIAVKADLIFLGIREIRTAHNLKLISPQF